MKQNMAHSYQIMDRIGFIKNMISTYQKNSLLNPNEVPHIQKHLRLKLLGKVEIYFINNKDMIKLKEENEELKYQQKKVVREKDDHLEELAFRLKKIESLNEEIQK